MKEENESLEFITNKQIRYKLNDLIECGPEKRDELVNYNFKDHIHIIWLGILVLIILINSKTIIYNLKEGNLILSLMFIIPVVFLVLCSFLGIGLFEKYKKATVLKKEMYIYDKRIVGENNDYQFRFWDKEKYVLKKWFSVSKKDYERELGSVGTIYLIIVPNDLTVVCEFEQKKEVD